MFFSCRVKLSSSWLIMKPHVQGALIHDVILRLMQFSPADEALWRNDGSEFIRQKFCSYENPPGILLLALCSRKGVVDYVLALVKAILQNPVASTGETYGALNMFGILASVLPRRSRYKHQLEYTLLKQVFPKLTSDDGFIRAISFRTLHVFHEVKIMDIENLEFIANTSINALLTDPDIPVRFEAAIAIQMFLLAHVDFAQFLAPRVAQAVTALLALSHDLHNPDVLGVLVTVTGMFNESLEPFIEEYCMDLVNSFKKQYEGNPGKLQRDMSRAIMTALNTINLATTEFSPIAAKLRLIKTSVSIWIIEKEVHEFYGDAFSFICDSAASGISPELWKLLVEIEKISLEKNAGDHCEEMMAMLYQYVTVGSDELASNKQYLDRIINTVQNVFTSDFEIDDKAKLAVSKLIEAFILQRLDEGSEAMKKCVAAAIEKLTKGEESLQMQSLHLQVISSAVYTLPEIFVKTMSEEQIDNGSETALAWFCKRMIQSSGSVSSAHECKLWLLTMCSLLDNETKSEGLIELADEIIPSFIKVLTELQLTRAIRERQLYGDEEEEEREFSESEEELSGGEGETMEIDNGNAAMIMEFAKQNYAPDIESGDGQSESEEEFEHDFVTSIDSADGLEYERFQTLMKSKSRLNKRFIEIILYFPFSNMDA